MKKRVAASLLWFYCGWYAMAIVAHAVGLSELVGPVGGAMVGALVGGDPFGRIWVRRGSLMQPGVNAVASA